MSAPFVSQIRARAGELRVGAGSATDVLHLRVQLETSWDIIRVAAPADTPVVAVKSRALKELDPRAAFHEDFVLKHEGWEILDENATLAAAGVRDGSTLILMPRRRRPVR